MMSTDSIQNKKGPKDSSIQSIHKAGQASGLGTWPGAGMGLSIGSNSRSGLLGPTRRQALGLVGYTLLGGSSIAQTAIKTSFDGLHCAEVMLNVDGYSVPVYTSAPIDSLGQVPKGLPVMLVISEIFGVHEYIADVTRRFAKAGYFAIAPELFIRQGDPQAYSDMQSLMKEVVSKVPDAQVMHDLDACVDWAGAQGAYTKRLGINGFCWGGRVSWLYAETNPQVKAAVAWYGRVSGEHNQLQPFHPIERVMQLKAPVLGLYGELDTSISKAGVDEMLNALTNAGERGVSAARKSKIKFYPNVGHAFHADYRASYNQAAAEDGWNLALNWFAQNGLRR